MAPTVANTVDAIALKRKRPALLGWEQPHNFLEKRAVAIREDIEFVEMIDVGHDIEVYRPIIIIKSIDIHLSLSMELIGFGSANDDYLWRVR